MLALISSWILGANLDITLLYHMKESDKGGQND